MAVFEEQRRMKTEKAALRSQNRPPDQCGRERYLRLQRDARGREAVKIVTEQVHVPEPQGKVSLSTHETIQERTQTRYPATCEEAGTLENNAHYQMCFHTSS